MTEEQMLEELKTWDDQIWKKFKQNNYETINLEFPKEESPSGLNGAERL
jgi:hypothetical protein